MASDSPPYYAGSARLLSDGQRYISDALSFIKENDIVAGATATVPPRHGLPAMRIRVVLPPVGSPHNAALSFKGVTLNGSDDNPGVVRELAFRLWNEPARDAFNADLVRTSREITGREWEMKNARKIAAFESWLVEQGRADTGSVGSSPPRQAPVYQRTVD